jgi:hypothetical protein
VHWSLRVDVSDYRSPVHASAVHASQGQLCLEECCQGLAHDTCAPTIAAVFPGADVGCWTCQHSCSLHHTVPDSTWRSRLVAAATQ